MSIDGKYCVMHDYSCMGEFKIKDGVVSDLSIENYDLFPIGYTMDKSGFCKWLSNRMISKSREHELCGTSRFEYMLRSFAISLSDHYWLCKEDLNVDWKSINPYFHPIDVYSPDATTGGSLWKTWTLKNDKDWFLIKGNSNDSCRQSVAEVFASRLHSKQGKFEYFDFCPYHFLNVRKDGKTELCCKTLYFTDFDIESVSAYDLLNMSECGRAPKKKNDMSWYTYYIQYTGSLGVDVQNFMDYMFMTDFLLTNTDRHLKNFGLIRDVIHFEFRHEAPIYDCGNSLFYNSNYVPIDSDLLDIAVNSFKKLEVEMLSLVKDRGVVDISKLPSDNDLYKFLVKDNSSEEHRERTVIAYNKKKKYLYEFQNGADIWTYNYMKNVR